MEARGASPSRDTFVVFHGDDVLAAGTASECARALGVKESTILWYASPAAHRRDNGSMRVAERVQPDE